MIYLIITTSINDKYGSENYNERKERYLYAIKNTLKNVPNGIKIIIVENNGKRETYLDNIYDNQNNLVDVIYTDNNKLRFKSKGVNELLDIKEVINKYEIKDDDIIIKLTGRYKIESDVFFKQIINTEIKYDAWIKFFGTCSLKFEEYDCILGCYAIRAGFLKLFNHFTIDNYSSAEIAFARYVKFCGARICEIVQLGVECCFGEDKRILNV